MCEAHNSQQPLSGMAGGTAGAGKVTFHVPGMTCGHCAATIRTALEGALPGAGVDIDLTEARVTVAGDETAAADAIRQAGYSPAPVGH